MGSEEAEKTEADFGKRIEFIGVQDHSDRRNKIVRFYFTREDGKKVEFTYLSKKDMLQVLSENIGVSENEKGGILEYMQNKYKPKPIEKQSQASQGKQSQTPFSAQQPEPGLEQRVEQAASGQEPILSPEERFMHNLEKCTSLYDAVERALGKIMANEPLDKKEIEVISTYFVTSKDLPEQYKQGLAERDKEIIAIKDFSKFMKENLLERIQESNEEVRKECKVKTDELKENYEGKLGELQGENLLQKEKYDADTEHLNFRIKDLESELSSLKLEKELGRPLHGDEIIEHAFGLPIGATSDGKTEDTKQPEAECKADSPKISLELKEALENANWKDFKYNNERWEFAKIGDEVYAKDNHNIFYRANHIAKDFDVIDLNAEFTATSFPGETKKLFEIFGSFLKDEEKSAQEKPEVEQPVGPKEYLYTKVKYVPGWFKKYHILRGENTDAIRVRVNSKVIYGNYFCEVDDIPYRFNLVYADDKKRNIELEQEEIAPEVLEQIIRDAVEAGLLPQPHFVPVKKFKSEALLDDDDSDMDDDDDELLRKTEPVKPERIKYTSPPSEDDD